MNSKFCNRNLISRGRLLAFLVVALIVAGSPTLAFAYDKGGIQGQMINIIYCEAGGRVTCDFHGYSGSNYHEGIDFALRSGTRICSMIDGEVVRVTNASGSNLSTCAIYDEARGKTVVYLHGEYSVSAGERVSQGEVIGVEAAHGNVTGPHTHIEVRNGRVSSAAKSSDTSPDNENPYPYWESVLNSNLQPEGDVNVCEGGLGTVRVAGWAYDPDDPGTSLSIHVYVGGPAGSGEGHIGSANLESPDVTDAFGVGGRHRYDLTFSTGLTGAQQVYVYAIDTAGGGNPLLTGSPHAATIEAYPIPDYDYGPAVALPRGDGYYTLSSSLDPRLRLDVDGGSGDDGTNVQVWHANGSDAQRFLFTRNADGTYTIANHGSGKVLDVEGVSLENGANVHQWAYVAGANQHWWVEDCGDGTYALKAAHSRGFLDVKDAIAKDGANVQQCRGNGHAAQRWLISGWCGPDANVEDGEYEVVLAADGGLALDVAGGSTEDGANVQVYEANHTAAQRFRISARGDGTYQILNSRSGKALDVSGASRADGATVCQRSANGADNQLWWIEDVGGAAVAIRAVHSGRCLDVEGGAFSSGTNVQQWRANGTQAQVWRLVSVGPDLSRDGWVDLGDGAKGYTRSKRLVTGWMDLGGSKYWFDARGHMATGWTDVDVSGKTMHYYFNPTSGNLARGTWMTIDGTKYYFRSSGNAAHGWATISDGDVDKKYYFDDDFRMVTGWCEIDTGQGYAARYYFRPSGAMATGWATIDGEKYFFRSSGNMATGFTTVDDAYKRYFDEFGHMLVGWQRIDGKTYYFRVPSGAMQTGKATIGGKSYEFSAAGALRSGTGPLLTTSAEEDSVDVLELLGDEGPEATEDPILIFEEDSTPEVLGDDASVRSEGQEDAMVGKREDPIVIDAFVL